MFTKIPFKTKFVNKSSDTKHTCLSGALLCAVCLLLRRHQPPDISDNNSAVVNFQNVATATAGKSMENNPGQNYQSFNTFYNWACKQHIQFMLFQMLQKIQLTGQEAFAYSQCLIIHTVFRSVSLLKGHISEVH